MAKYSQNSKLPKGLLLCNYQINQGAVTIESINTFLDHSEYPVYPYTLDRGFSEDFPYDQFDFIIIHYSIIPTLAGYLTDAVKNKLRDFKGPIFLFGMDEYRRTTILKQFMREVGVTAFFTVSPPETAKKIYADVPGLKLYTVLTGYASHWLNVEKTVPLYKRKVGVGYRGREYPAWFGKTINLKVDLAKKLRSVFKKNRIKVDISVRERDRIYGRDWVRFLKKCRAVYGTETDVDFIDPSGSVAHWYGVLEALNRPKKRKKKWDGNVVFESDFFKENAVPVPDSLAVIPPRIFESMSLRSVSILIPGSYSGILVPWRHYIPIEADLSNIKEVVKALKDNEVTSNIIANAYAEIASNEKYMWQGFGRLVDSAFKENLTKITPKPKSHLLSEERLRKLSGPFYYTQNPHAVAIENFQKGGVLVAMKQFFRTKWHKLLARYRQIIRYQPRDDDD